MLFLKYYGFADLSLLLPAICSQYFSQAGPHTSMVAPFSFKHTGMHCFAQSDRVSALLTQAIVITKQINNETIVFFETIIVDFFFSL